MTTTTLEDWRKNKDEGVDEVNQASVTPLREEPQHRHDHVEDDDEDEDTTLFFDALGEVVNVSLAQISSSSGGGGGIPTHEEEAQPTHTAIGRRSPTRPPPEGKDSYFPFHRTAVRDDKKGEDTIRGGGKHTFLAGREGVVGRRDEHDDVDDDDNSNRNEVTEESLTESDILPHPDGGCPPALPLASSHSAGAGGGVGVVSVGVGPHLHVTTIVGSTLPRLQSSSSSASGDDLFFTPRDGNGKVVLLAHSPSTKLVRHPLSASVSPAKPQHQEKVEEANCVTTTTTATAKENMSLGKNDESLFLEESSRNAVFAFQDDFLVSTSSSVGARTRRLTPSVAAGREKKKEVAEREEAEEEKRDRSKTKRKTSRNSRVLPPTAAGAAADLPGVIAEEEEEEADPMRIRPSSPSRADRRPTSPLLSNDEVADDDDDFSEAEDSSPTDPFSRSKRSTTLTLQRKASATATPSMVNPLESLTNTKTIIPQPPQGAVMTAPTATATRAFLQEEGQEANTERTNDNANDTCSTNKAIEEDNNGNNETSSSHLSAPLPSMRVSKKLLFSSSGSMSVSLQSSARSSRETKHQQQQGEEKEEGEKKEITVEEKRDKKKEGPPKIAAKRGHVVPPVQSSDKYIYRANVEKNDTDGLDDDDDKGNKESWGDARVFGNERRERVEEQNAAGSTTEPRRNNASNNVNGEENEKKKKKKKKESKCAIM